MYLIHGLWVPSNDYFIRRLQLDTIWCRWALLTMCTAEWLTVPSFSFHAVLTKQWRSAALTGLVYNTGLFEWTVAENMLKNTKKMLYK